MLKIAGPGRDLDALLAEKVMQWEVITYHNHESVHKATGTVIYAKGAEWPVYENSCSYPRPWFPSTELTATWEIVMKVRGMGYRFSVEDHGADGWVITFSKQGEHHIGAAEDFKYAVCRAALNVVGCTE